MGSMPIERFPDPLFSDENGLLAVGGDLHPESLLLAYRSGIFPWPMDEESPILWFSPKNRAIIEFQNFHPSKSLIKLIKQKKYFHTIDKAFTQTIQLCSKRETTWITAEMKSAYSLLHKQGYAHSVEIWSKETMKLVGGVYGVEVDGVFSAESMFHSENNTSKLALYYLIQHLKKKGQHWIDVQVINPHLKTLGATTLSQKEFLQKLKQSQTLNRRS